MAAIYNKHYQGIKPVPARCGQERWPERRSNDQGDEPEEQQKPKRMPLLGLALVLGGWPLVVVLVALCMLVAEQLPYIAR